MKKIPYGIIDYRKLKEENYIYVDKTMYLSKLEESESTIIYLRPGRFGKSLFTSMMYYYYDVNSESLFESLFKDTYVYDNRTSKKNSYYVLNLDFSGINGANRTKKELEDKFKACVIQGLESFISRYDFDYSIDYNLDADVMIKLFFSYFESLRLENKIYVIVDEYDNFTNELLEGDALLFKNIVNENGFVKSFYSVIKIYVKEGVVDRFYATGICPVTLNSMTTGFNIASDKSLHKEFNSMIGLTHKEVLNLMKELGLSEEERNNIFEIMVENYDGYLFTKKLGEEERVFNATLVMYFLKEYISLGEKPDQLYDNNIVVNYGKVDNLIKLQGNKFYKELIREILERNEISSELKTQFNIVEDFTREDIVSLLYYFGYLTIKEEGIGKEIVFRVPNMIMKEAYNNYLIKMLREIEVDIDNRKVREVLIEIIKEGKVEKISEYVSEVLKLIDNRLFNKFDEKYIEMLYFAILMGNKEFKVYTEYPSESGYVDVMIIGNREYMDKNIMIELKYIKKSEYREEEIEIKKEEGREQLERYSKDPRVRDNLRKYVVVFVGNDVKLIESV